MTDKQFNAIRDALIILLGKLECECSIGAGHTEPICKVCDAVHAFEYADRKDGR